MSLLSILSINNQTVTVKFSSINPKNILSTPLFCIGLILLLSNCNPNETNPSFTPKSTQIVFFDEVEFEKQYKELNLSERWEFVEKFSKTTFENPLLAEKWLQGKIKQLTAKIEYVPAQSLRNLLVALYNSNFLNTSNTTAQFTLQSKFAPKLEKAHPAAAAILSHYYLFRKEIDSAVYFSNILEKTIENDTANWLKLSLFTGKAGIQDFNGNFFESIVNYQKALEYIPDSDSFNLFQTYLNIGITYHSMDYHDKAKNYLDKALLYSIKDDNLPQEQLVNIAAIHAKAGDFEKAQTAYDKAIEYAIKNDLSGIMAQIYSNLGNFYRRKKEYAAALQYMDDSDSICTVNGIKVGHLFNSINRAETFLEMGDHKEALRILQKSEPLLSLYTFPKIFSEFHRLSYLIYDIIGDKNNANYHYREFNEIARKKMGDLPRSVIAEWELSREREIAELNKKELEISLQKEVFTKYMITLILSVLLLAMGIIYLLVNRKHLLSREKLNNEKQRIAFELENKSRELLSDSLKSISIQNAKENIKEELELILKDIPKMHHARFAPFLRKLSLHNNQNVLEEFETRFTGVYDKFYERLKEIAPDLTPNEIRICALMRLNISTKEIALLTNRTVGTIDNTRSSIRKKINLDEQINLQQYLIEL